MWAFGNYARFIRPGMKRVEVQLNQANTQISGFTSGRQTVLVIVNAGGDFELEIPAGKKNQKITTYITSESENLGVQQTKNHQVSVPKESVLTLVYENL